MSKYFMKQAYLNPVMVQGRELKDIIFFNSDGIIFKANRGWLEGNKYPRRITMEDIDLDYDETLKVKRKVVFNKEKIFLVNRKPDYYENQKYYEIYIHTDFIEYKKSPDFYSPTINHCYREFYCTINELEFVIHQHIEDETQKQISNIKYHKLSDVKKKIELMDINGIYSPLFKEIHDLQVEYTKLQNELLKKYTKA